MIRFYLTTEHYFQAAKFTSTDPVYSEHVRLACTAEQAVQMASATDSHPLQSEWDRTRDRVMRRALRLKLNQNSTLKELLSTTSPFPLIAQSETDLYWGVNEQGEGENRYGALLEELRGSEMDEAPDVVSTSE